MKSEITRLLISKLTLIRICISYIEPDRNRIEPDRDHNGGVRDK